MTQWNEFLSSLATRGGRIIIGLIVLFTLFGIGVLFVYFPPTTDDKIAVAAATAIVGLVSMFAAVTISNLRGGNPPNNGDVTKPKQKRRKTTDTSVKLRKTKR